MKVLLGKGGPSEAGWHGIEKISLCEQEYLYNVVRGIKKPSEYNPDHYSIGSIFHAGRARWFSRRFATGAKTWRLIKEAMEREAEQMELPVSFRATKMDMAYLVQYIDHYRLLPKPDPVAAEYLLGPAKFKPDDPLYMFRTARLDDVSRYDEAAGQLAIGESKTTSGTIGDCVTQYKLHGQPILQYMLWKAAPQGEAMHGPVVGTVLDITKKGYGARKCTFSRVFVPFEPRVLEWFHRTLSHYLKRAAQIDWNSKVTRNVAVCSRMGGRGRVSCDYLDLCMYGRSGTIGYVMKDGSSLQHFKRTEEKRALPWE